MKPYIRISLHSFLAIFLLTACTIQPGGGQTDIATPVSVVELKKGSISKYFNTTGSANPTMGVQLNSLMTGNYRLLTNPKTGKPYKLGDAVVKGQVILRLEDAEYENSIAIEGKKLNLEISEQNLTKQKALYEKGGVTQSEVKNTEVQATNARYDYETAELNLEKMNIRAPFNGVIVDLPYYTPGVQVQQGSLMVSLMDYGKMYLEVNLPESAINEIKIGQSAKITHYTLPNDTLVGTITELSPAISMETRTFKGKVEIKNEALLLRPGMFVKAAVEVDHADSTIVIPKEVIQTQRNRRYVFVVERNTAVQRAIRTGLEDDVNIEVIEGLKANENLIVRGYETLRENSPVKVQR
ncbi:MAG: efflux RND transporter periplasmic adaptor subunit [Prevotellaceae bacterium]|jgi:RND family efflux transporter MFP subunit|nr:efflux RND transporter periplasmic adaptor subunit [Prevotellaceae bacterium]